MSAEGAKWFVEYVVDHYGVSGLLISRLQRCTKFIGLSPQGVAWAFTFRAFGAETKTIAPLLSPNLRA